VCVLVCVCLCVCVYVRVCSNRFKSDTIFQKTAKYG